MIGRFLRFIAGPSMNAFADRAVHETIHALTAEISINQLEHLIDNAKKSGEKYTTLSKLWFEHQQKQYPQWRKE